MNEIRQMSPLQQSQVMCDLANHADTPICRTYGTWSANIKLGFLCVLLSDSPLRVVIPTV